MKKIREEITIECNYAEMFKTIQNYCENNYFLTEMFTFKKNNLRNCQLKFEKNNGGENE